MSVHRGNIWKDDIDGRTPCPGKHGEAHRHLSSVFRQWENSASYISQPKQCSVCWTEYQFDILNLQQSGVAVFITKWQELVSGTDDLRWKANLADYPERASFEPGSLVAAYKKHRPLAFKPLMTPKSKRAL